jgi:hypothetical protein
MNKHMYVYVCIDISIDMHYRCDHSVYVEKGSNTIGISPYLYMYTYIHILSHMYLHVYVYAYIDISIDMFNANRGAL